jgi:hypothetical protein
MTVDKWAEYREAERKWLREGGYKTELEMTMSPAVTRLRASHDRLLKAAKRSRLVLEEYCFSPRSNSVEGCLDELRDVSATAEEFMP